MREAFLAMDEDRDGYIGHAEFCKLLRQWGIHAPDIELQTITRAYDIDGDGMVSVSDFLRAMAF